ncbi:MAG: hypothetical protein IMZ43_01485 [Thermoplasmata archaeon]|nr:hypothetical protein [Thermoplasmata archaeon]
MKKQILLIALLALITMAAMPVQAQTITMSNPDATMERDIIVYSVNDTGLTNVSGLYGLYNTTSIIDIDPNLSYLFVLKPQYSNPLDNPVGWLNSLMAYAKDNATALLFIAVLLGIIFTRKW